MKPTKGQRIFAVFNYILLTLLALLCLLPMLNIVALSFSSRNMVNAGAVTFLPKVYDQFLSLYASKEWIDSGIVSNSKETCAWCGFKSDYDDFCSLSVIKE